MSWAFSLTAFISFVGENINFSKLNRRKTKTSSSTRYISATRGGELTLCATSPPLFKGNIFVAHCMPLSTRLNGWPHWPNSVTFAPHQNLQIAILDKYLALVTMTAGPSRVINISTVEYRCVFRLPLSTNAERATHQWILFTTDDTEKYSKMQHA